MLNAASLNSSNRDTARHPGLTKKISIQHILTANQSWWNFYEKYNHKIRPAILIGITKLLSCKNKFRGYLNTVAQIQPANTSSVFITPANPKRVLLVGKNQWSIISISIYPPPLVAL